jgi:hypothetical protein
VAGGMLGRGNRNTSRKPSPSAALSTTNLTWPDPVSTSGRRGGKPATIRLSHGTALPRALSMRLFSVLRQPRACHSLAAITSITATFQLVA